MSKRNRFIYNVHYCEEKSIDWVNVFDKEISTLKEEISLRTCPSGQAGLLRNDRWKAPMKKNSAIKRIVIPIRP